MAIRINLLPHREARRERQKKLFWFFTAASAVAGAALVGMVWTVLQGYIGAQIERNEFITAENRKLDNQIKEIATLRQEIEALRARQRSVEDLQADRNQPVYMLAELTRLTPEGIFLRTIRQEGTRVNVAGFAASNERVSEYLRNLQNNSPFVERPELIEIKVAGQTPQAGQRRMFEFSLNFFMRPTPERAQLKSGKPAAARPAPAAAVPATQTAQK